MKPSTYIPFTIALISGIASFIFFLFGLDAAQYVSAAVCLLAFMATERNENTEASSEH